MKPFSIGLLLGIMLVLPGSAESAGQMHRIVSFEANLKEVLQNDADWKMCGDSFAIAETQAGKAILFTLEMNFFGFPLKTLMSTSDDQATVSLEKQLKTPMVIISGNGQDLHFAFRMNAEDYFKVGLPCLAKGTKA